MKVKVGDKIYDGNDEPVMVILTDQDKSLISNMSPYNNKFCSYPNSPYWTENNYERIKEWMKEE